VVPPGSAAESAAGGFTGSAAGGSTTDGSTADDSTGGGSSDVLDSVGRVVVVREPPPWFALPGLVVFVPAPGVGVAGATVGAGRFGLTTESEVAGASSVVVSVPVEFPVFTPSPGEESGHQSSTTTINATAASPAAPT
jgi:hypothetical protein